MSLPVSLQLYRALTGLASPLLPAILSRRARAGKEDAARRHERLGRPDIRRPGGKLLWLHGASVGESLVLATLVDELAQHDPDLEFLVTTGTVTSATLMGKRLPPQAKHQYVPVDTPGAVRRFLDHWRPDAGVIAESELWPNLLIEARLRDIPMALVNARMNAGSLQRWRKRGDALRRLLEGFDWIGAADTRTRDGLEDLTGREIVLAGNLKLEARPLAPDAGELAALKSGLAGRPIWLAASTHDGEDDVVLSAHARLHRTHPGALLILAPRHPERGDALEARIKQHGFAVARRSRGEVPEPRDTVWLADTLGEMPLWFALAPAALIAGSLLPDIGGHNPIEASQAGASVITGPHVASFDDVYAAYRRHDAVLEVDDAPSLAQAVEQVWQAKGPGKASAGRAIADVSGGALETSLAAINRLLNRADKAGAST
ncbi:3-deoxy-D-manno-octulosonic acid transferase [Maricaulis sp. W15]|uniref:3-deoxy-D-manno-octulosonic acid transferase n=1 Tax=Maricaulis sp. W15 TaxID=1772333 RepID=UPI0009491112|nr:3-deoxy-D-manno-octulosonic acid transferase [Maricaulis sp. W15]OLF81590.1 3-deoxy-D-manno-octulosonic acid transferase [Maricaulis sp. W15]